MGLRFKKLIDRGRLAIALHFAEFHRIPPPKFQMTQRASSPGTDAPTDSISHEYVHSLRFL